MRILSSRGSQELRVKDTPPRKRIRHWILLFFLLSGSTGLIYEIAWMKMLILVVGNTVHSTATVLASFMGGLALGSFLAGKFLDKFKNPLRTYGLLEGMIAVNAVLVPLLIAGTHPLFRYLYQSSDTSPHEIGLLRVVVCGVILLVPTSLMGATLPILCKFFALRETELGWTVGKLYGINTLGAVLGSSAAGFLLIPTLGIGWTVRLAALLNLGIAAAVWILCRASAGTELEQTASKVKEKKRLRVRDLLGT